MYHYCALVSSGRLYFGWDDMHLGLAHSNKTNRNLFTTPNSMVTSLSIKCARFVYLVAFLQARTIFVNEELFWASLQLISKHFDKLDTTARAPWDLQRHLLSAC